MYNKNVSIIIPTFNNAVYIRDALESVFSQSYSSYEIIVIDDGSTDDTQTILKSYLNQIQYIYQEHSGVAIARNRGLSIASGKYVAFLDSDDLFFPDKLEAQVKFLDNNSEIGAVHSGWLLVNDDKNLIAKKEPWHHAPKLGLKEWLIWQPIFLGAMLFRGSWLKKVGGFDTSLSQASDAEFLLRLVIEGCPTAWLKQPTVYYRQHASGITNNSFERVVCVNKVIEDFFSQKNLSRDIQLMEKNIRYQILMWSVWLLYRRGNTNHIIDYLRKTLAYLNDSPKHIIHNWLSSLIQNYRVDGDYEIEELQNLWPYFKEVLHKDETTSTQNGRLFYWLLQSEIKLISRNKNKRIIESETLNEK